MFKIVMGCLPNRPVNLPGLQPCQIVCLEHEYTTLYAEVIQVVEVRQICWVRPLVLKERSPSAQDSTPSECSSEAVDARLYDLREGSDLLLPVTFFRPAYDTEMLPLFSFLTPLSPSDHPAPKTNQPLLHQFLQRLCQVNAAKASNTILLS